jgi:hypothetical protein
MPKVCLANFDSSNCHYWVDAKLPKEVQVQHCQKLKCQYGSVTEQKINGELYIKVTCDCSWSPFDNRPLTEEEKEDYR